jgi:hypothetical protein
VNSGDIAELTDPQQIKIEMLKLRLVAKRRIDPKGCWIWTGSTDGDGLGLIKVCGVRVIVHRLALALWKGLVLNRNQLALLTCGTDHCFHPEHREILSRAQRRQAAAKEKKRDAMQGGRRERWDHQRRRP